MKPNLIQTCLLAALLALPAVVQAQFNYTTNNGTITITGYTGSGGAVTIPATINGLPVTSIGYDAFYEHSYLTSVTMPDSVTNIGDWAFADTSLTNVAIGNSITLIGDWAFADCFRLTAITVDINNPVYSSVNGVLFDKSQTTVIQYPGGLGGSYTIPDSVTSIGNEAFEGCILTNVTIGNSVTDIGDEAFLYCNLSSITIPDSVTSIGDSAFYRCVSLTSARIGNSVTNIGDGAFGDCYSLASVTIPNSVTIIGEGAFDHCVSLISVAIPNSVISIGATAFADTSLTSITIPNSVTNIGNRAFEYCASLTSVMIPDSVTIIGDGAFFGCNSLIAITVNTDNPAYSSANGVLFDKSQATLIQYPPGKAGSYIVPNGVIDIGDAFEGCTGLNGVTIPDSVMNIGDDAFSGCTSLTNITIDSNSINDSVNSFSRDIFYHCDVLTSVTIGKSVTDIEFLVLLPRLTTINVEADNLSYSSVTGVLFDKSQTMLIQYPMNKTGGFYIIPNSVINIGNRAFAGCQNVAEVTIGNSVTNIGEYAFLDTGLTSVTIPNSVTSIGDSAFDSCTSLMSVTIPNRVTSIGNYAFFGCSSLTNVVIPDSVVSIGRWAFEYCTSLTSVYFKGNAPAADGSVFINYGPDGQVSYKATAYYLPGTTGWDDFSINTYIPAVPWLPLIQTGDAGFGVRTNQFGFNIAWASGQTVVVEACTNLANPVWFPVATNTLVNGSSYFSDPQPANLPGRFYRLRSP